MNKAMEDAMAQFDQAHEDVGEAINAMGRKFIEDGIRPDLLILATFHHGVARPTVLNVPNDRQLFICDVLETFVKDTREIIGKWNN